MRDIVDGQLVASGFCSASQIGQRPRDHKRYKVADYPKVTNRTQGLAAYPLRSGAHRCRPPVSHLSGTLSAK
jgi:hypothetical protein